MNPVAEIFAAFGNSPTKLSRAIGVKVQTVFDWSKAPVNIPEWRRAAVLEAVRKNNIALSPETFAYLGAKPARKPARKSSDQAVAA